MYEFELSYLTKMRIWLKPMNDFLLTNSTKKTFEFPSQSLENTSINTIIVELFIPLGGRYLYGLLGADYIPSNSNSIQVSIFSGNLSNPKIIETPYIMASDTVHRCMPDEYRNAVIDEIKHLSECNKINISGELLFQYGGISNISSSESIVRKITKLIIDLLSFNDISKLTSERIDELLSI